MSESKTTQPVASSEEVEKLKEKITQQGDKVRNLKTNGAPKVSIVYLANYLSFGLQ